MLTKERLSPSGGVQIVSGPYFINKSNGCDNCNDSDNSESIDSFNVSDRLDTFFRLDSSNSLGH